MSQTTTTTTVMAAADLARILEPASIALLLVTVIVFAIPVFIIFPPVPVERSDALRQTHGKIGVPSHQSKLRDQRNANLHQPAAANDGSISPGRIQSLHIYPLKSCSGIELTETSVLPNGLEHDRVFCFAQRKKLRVPASPGSEELILKDRWEVLTLRQAALLANVKVDLWLPDATKKSRQLGHVNGGFVVGRFPWKDAGLRGIVQTIAAKISRGMAAVPEKEFLLPLEFPSPEEVKERGYSYADIRVFAHTPKALDMGVELPPELRTYLGVANDLTVFRMDPSLRRDVTYMTPAKEEVGYQTEIDFQDGYPVNVLSLTSVHDLESKIIKDDGIEFLDIRRFRPNIIMTGLPSYDEDDWKCVQFRDAKVTDKDNFFHVSCRAVRCKLPNVDPVTGIRHKIEPDRSLRKHRDIDQGSPKKGCLGMQLCPLYSDKENRCLTLRVGMEANVLERGDHISY